MVEWPFLAVTWGCLRFVIVVFPDHSHLLFLMPLILHFEVKINKLGLKNASMTISSNMCGKIEGMIFMSSDIFEQINIG